MNKTEMAATTDLIAVQRELAARLLEAEALLREVVDIWVVLSGDWHQRVKAFLERTG